MYNDFVLVGPRSDPAGVRGADIATALGKIASSASAFLSRGDSSGTQAAELRYWALAGSGSKGSGYRECGCGMGPALNIAASTGAYALAARATWLSFRNRGDLTVLVQGDRRLFNQYGAIAINPARHPHVNAAQAQRFVDWLVSPAGQSAIAAYRVGGAQLFFPNAAAAAANAP
jgi:tungstate transport system substrate-binding protein